jgi:hypothetical protein
MPRRNTPARGRRWKAQPVTPPPETNTPSYEALARQLVRRGKAHPAILDNPQTLHDQPKENR